MANVEHGLSLKPLDQSGHTEIIEIPEDGLGIGRDSENRLVLEGEEYRFVSAFHARLFFDGDRLVVEDLDSKNGTSVNGKRVERRALRPGDLLQIGHLDGVRFLVVHSACEHEDTQVQAVAPRSSQSLSPSRVKRLQHALRLPEDPRHELSLSRRYQRRSFVAAAVLVLSMVTLGAIWVLSFQTQQDDSIGQLAEDNVVLRGMLADTTERLREQQTAWIDERTTLEYKRNTLEEQLRDLQQVGKMSAGEISQIRTELRSTRDRLDRFEPVDLELLERNRREMLEQAIAAVVYIETNVMFRERGSDRYMHDDQPRLRERTQQNASLVRRNAGTGSGFCVSSDGWILTNAHVVTPTDPPREIRFEQSVLEIEVEVNVVFSGTGERRRATVVATDAADPHDLALLRIEPFEGMPFLPQLRTDEPPPSPGTNVRLFGFPLGDALLQQQGVYSASVFSGIVSRRIEPYFQVQAAVYPGNSGGPVLTDDGRILGIVTAVQTVPGPGGQIASDIGYVLPISVIQSLWPPAPDAKLEELIAAPKHD
ncbi:MAG: trypsin-like peptidase domain-containing protein [Planctomycetota bacterium]